MSLLLLPVSRPIWRAGLACGRVSVTGVRSLAVSCARPKVATMKQVEVDEADTQKQLGRLQMDFVRKVKGRQTGLQIFRIY